MLWGKKGPPPPCLRRFGSTPIVGRNFTTAIDVVLRQVCHLAPRMFQAPMVMREAGEILGTRNKQIKWFVPGDSKWPFFITYLEGSLNLWRDHLTLPKKGTSRTAMVFPPLSRNRPRKVLKSWDWSRSFSKKKHQAFLLGCIFMVFFLQILKAVQ